MKLHVVPAIQSIKFSFSNLTLSRVTIRVFDLMGKLLVYHANPSKKELTLPVHYSGFVMVKVDSNEGSYTKLVAIS